MKWQKVIRLAKIKLAKKSKQEKNYTCIGSVSIASDTSNFNGTSIKSPGRDLSPLRYWSRAHCSCGFRLNDIKEA